MRFGARGQATPLRRVWVWLDLDKYVWYPLLSRVSPWTSWLVSQGGLRDYFLTAAALTSSLAYFPMRARSSGVKEVVYLRKALTAWLTSWSTLGDSCVWVVAGWKYRRRLMVQLRKHCTKYSTSCTYHVTNVLHFNLLRKFISANKITCLIHAVQW